MIRLDFADTHGMKQLAVVAEELMLDISKNSANAKKGRTDDSSNISTH